jgi:UDPglucose 6-dehydrogenase
MCKKLGIDTYEVADGIGLDSRIKRDFLNSGIGWGGSCFPKDTKALNFWAKKENIDHKIIDSVIDVNEKQPLKIIGILKKHVKDIRGKNIGVLGLSFKADTNDIRESRSVLIVKELLKKGAIVSVFDPVAMESFKKIFPEIKYCSSADEVLKSDAVIISTIWDEFKKLDYSDSIVIDGRNLKEARNAKIYEGICW